MGLLRALEHTPQHTSLYRFMIHWIAWTKFRVYKKEPLPTLTRTTANDVTENYNAKDCLEYTNAFASSEGWSSIDQRKYFMAHWTESCSTLVDARCHHRRICHFFAIFGDNYLHIRPNDTQFQLAFQLEEGRLRRIRPRPRPHFLIRFWRKWLLVPEPSYSCQLVYY
jgi:hypothetical protein